MRHMDCTAKHARREEKRRRQAAERMRGLFADLTPGRRLSDDLIAERRAEARAEDRGLLLRRGRGGRGVDRRRRPRPRPRRRGRRGPARRDTIAEGHVREGRKMERETISECKFDEEHHEYNPALEEATPQEMREVEEFERERYGKVR